MNEQNNNSKTGEYRNQITLLENQILENEKRLKDLEEEDQKNNYLFRKKNQLLQNSYLRVKSEKSIRELNKMENEYKEDNIRKTNRNTFEREEIEKIISSLKRKKENIENMLKKEIIKERGENK